MALLKSLKFAFYILAHPFDGFWILKSEKKGTVKSAAIILALFILTMTVRVYSTGYLFSSVSLSGFSVWLMALAVIAVLFLYCLSNWAISTLVDGKGSFAEIFISVAYALTPVILVNVPLTALSNIITAEEGAFHSVISMFSIMWAVFLLLAGNLSIHDFTMVKSIVIVMTTLIFMFVIAVLLILFGNMLQQVYIFLKSIFSELSFRISSVEAADPVFSSVKGMV